MEDIDERCYKRYHGLRCSVTLYKFGGSQVGNSRHVGIRTRAVYNLHGMKVVSARRLFMVSKLLGANAPPID